MKYLLFVILLAVFSGFDKKVEHPSNNEVCLTREELKLYRLIMDYRENHKLDSIPISAKLSMVAQAHARDLMKNYKFDVSNECNPHSWSGKGKWTPCCYTSDHKAAACMWQKPQEIAGYPGSGYEIAYYSSSGATAAEGLEGWKKSPGHNPLLINTGIWKEVKWKAIGVAIYGEYGLVWFGEEADPTAIKECD